MSLTRPAGARLADCPLCGSEGGSPIAQDDRLRVVGVDERLHPGFVRVIWHDHVSEMSALDRSDRDHLMNVVFELEAALRESLQPDKINLASLGNVVSHLHWHVIARFDWDARWPAPVWAPRQREVAQAESRLALPLPELDRRVAESLQAG